MIPLTRISRMFDLENTQYLDMATLGSEIDVEIWLQGSMADLFPFRPFLSENTTRKEYA